MEPIVSCFFFHHEEMEWWCKKYFCCLWDDKNTNFYIKKPNLNQAKTSQAKHMFRDSLIMSRSVEIELWCRLIFLLSTYFDNQNNKYLYWPLFKWSLYPGFDIIAHRRDGIMVLRIISFVSSLHWDNQNNNLYIDRPKLN